MCANCKCPRENHDVSVDADADVDVDEVEFKVKGLKINSDTNREDDLPSPPPLSNNNEYQTMKIFTTQSSLVDNDLFPPPPPPSTASDYLWSPPGLTTGQVRKNKYSFFDQSLFGILTNLCVLVIFLHFLRKNPLPHLVIKSIK